MRNPFADGAREQLVTRLSQSMESLLRDADRCKRMSLESIERIRSNFTWPQKAAQIVTIYRDLLGLPHDELRSFSLNGQTALFLCPMESEGWRGASRWTAAGEAVARIVAADCLTAWPLRGQWPAGPPVASEPCNQEMMES